MESFSFMPTFSLAVSNFNLREPGYSGSDVCCCVRTHIDTKRERSTPDGRGGGLAPLRYCCSNIYVPSAHGYSDVLVALDSAAEPFSRTSSTIALVSTHPGALCNVLAYVLDDIFFVRWR